MTIPSTKVPTAREAAIAAIEEAMLGTLPVPFGVLSEKVETLIDAVTAAIEARDATLRSAVEAEMRPAVRAFALLMETKLRENDHKGGWQHDGTEALMKRLRQEADELGDATEMSGAWCSAPPRANLNYETRLRIGREAADVANFAMMIADVCGALATGEKR